MKFLFSFLIFCFLSIALNAQIFDQILPLDQIIKNDKAYIVLTSGDTLKGRLTGTRDGGREKRVLIQDGDNAIYRLVIRTEDKEQVEVSLDAIKLVAIVPTLGMAKFTQTNLGGDLSELNRVRKDPYIKNLMNGEKLITLEPPKDTEKWIFYESVKVGYNQIRGSAEPDFELRQLLNPTFDSRIKVYPETPKNEVENTNETKINGIKIASNNPGSFLISIDGKPIQRIQQFGHRKNAKAKIFRNCAIISEKPNWKDFALDVFKDHMECGDKSKATMILK